MNHQEHTLLINSWFMEKLARYSPLMNETRQHWHEW